MNPDLVADQAKIAAFFNELEIGQDDPSDLELVCLLCVALVFDVSFTKMNLKIVCAVTDCENTARGGRASWTTRPYLHQGEGEARSEAVLGVCEALHGDERHSPFALFI